MASIAVGSAFQRWRRRIVAWSTQNRSTLLVAIGIAIIGLVILATSALPRASSVLTAIDVGQGDGLVLRTRHGQVILIDGGNSPEYLGRLQRQLGLFHRHIDLLILTHPHDDHLNGLITVLERFTVERVLWTGVIEENPGYDELKRMLAIMGPDRAVIAHAGQEFHIDGGVIRVLWPRTSLTGANPPSEREGGSGGLNDTSIVTEISIDGVRIVSMGDVSSVVEERMLDDLREVDILKVGHHGSRFSTSERFVDRVKPKIAIISVGAKNDYNHPAQSVIARLEGRGARVLRTDQDGTVSVELTPELTIHKSR
ncbi:MBL fold metallo-hydrolase [Candidatus Uhrbacteria bacterium]|nr:MBL fold metallo-hydrolase [Candidatus Uhrbacteria bacterium]